MGLRYIYIYIYCVVAMACEFVSTTILFFLAAVVKLITRRFSFPDEGL